MVKPKLAYRPPHHLSGGEKRMVSIAGVMAMRPRLVIYDEPSANLDMRARRRLIEFLQQADIALLFTCDCLVPALLGSLAPKRSDLDYSL